MMLAGISLDLRTPRSPASKTPAWRLGLAIGDWRLAIGDNIVGTSGPHIKYLRRDGGVLEVRITFNAVKA